MWAFGRLSLTHFDEGIYAIAGLWSVSRHGLLEIDPGVIPYAPPGFPILVGLSYLVFGVSDYAAIAVAVLAGIVTIPVVGWLGRRTFGPGAGAAAAAFAALALSHVAFSRKALTDAPFLLAWLVALGTGQRFLERPGFLRALSIGAAVGVAQNFKYNGWLGGVIVALAAIAGVAFQPGQRRRGPLLHTFGWGLVAALVGSVLYTPWYAYVETHGGYGALLRHHRGYVDAAAWWPHLGTQLSEAYALSGTGFWGQIAALVGLCGAGLSVDGSFFARLRTVKVSPALAIGAVLGALLFLFQGYFPWWLGLFWTPRLLVAQEPSRRIAASCWLVMAILTPMYHPYARLWLPLHAIGWVFMAGMIAALATGQMTSEPTPGAMDAGRSGRHLRRTLAVTALAGGLAAGLHVALAGPRAIAWSRVLEPGRANLRDFAFKAVPYYVSPKGTLLRIYARRPLAYYLALQGEFAVQIQPDIQSLLESGPPGSWAVCEYPSQRLGDPWVQKWKDSSRVVASRSWLDTDPVTQLDFFPEAACDAKPEDQWPMQVWEIEIRGPLMTREQLKLFLMERAMEIDRAMRRANDP
jgi:4-amino-4-deoxy-L-arabinose transferase-like glycosyltransferase